MTDVFAPAELAGIRFQNRVIRSATMEDGADDKGFPTEGLTKKYLALAKGGVGGIITGFMGITAEGKAQQPGMVLLDDDAKIGPLKSLTDAESRRSRTAGGTAYQAGSSMLTRCLMRNLRK